MLLFKRLLLAVISAFIGLILAEGGHRTILAVRGEAYSISDTRDEFKRIAYPNREFIPGQRAGTTFEGAQLHPYSGSEKEHDTGGVLAHFRKGTPRHEFTVLVVGGSVAAGWANRSPRLFKQALKADPRFANKSIKVLNYAHHSYKQPQQLTRIAYLLSMGYRPDAVINLDGFNETALAMAGTRVGIHPLYPSMPVWGVIVKNVTSMDGQDLAILGQLWEMRTDAREEIEFVLDNNLHGSSIIGSLALNRARAYTRENVTLQQTFGIKNEGQKRLPRQVRGPDFNRKQGAILKQCARNWYESSVSLDAMCKARGIAYLHVLQPSLYDKGSKTKSPEEETLPEPPFGWRSGPEHGYPLLRKAGSQLLELGVAFHDASQVFVDVKEKVYHDACHLEVFATDLLTVEIAAAFLASLE